MRSKCTFPPLREKLEFRSTRNGWYDWIFAVPWSNVARPR
jgi:hypothetical protein